MPLTPFHAGPGLLGKSIVPERFSFAAFCTVQIAVDLEPLYYLVRGQYPVHRFFHSIAGSLLAAGVVAITFVLGRRVLRASLMRTRLLRDEFRSAAIWIGSLVGGLSHVLLDFAIHSDVRLVYPSDLGLGSAGFVDVGVMSGACIVSGVAGLALLGWRYLRS